MASGIMFYAQNMLLPALKMMMYGIAFLAIVIPAGYYLIILRKRRIWYATIWERRGDNDAIIVSNDKVIEKRLKKKNAHVYTLNRVKYKVPPVDERYVKTLRGKNYVNYLRVGSDYVPFIQKFNFDGINFVKNEDGIMVLQGNGERVFTPMPYEVMMQMLNIDDGIESIWADKLGFFEKYKEIIAIAILCVTIIVLMTQYFDFVAKSLEPVKASTSALQDMAKSLMGR